MKTFDQLEEATQVKHEALEAVKAKNPQDSQEVKNAQSEYDAALAEEKASR